MDVNAELARLAQLARLPRQDVERLACAMGRSVSAARAEVYRVRKLHRAALYRLRELDNAT